MTLSAGGYLSRMHQRPLKADSREAIRSYGAAATAGQPDQRKQDIAPEDNAGIAGREIVGGDHLVDMAARRSKHEDAGADDRRETKVEARERGEEPHDGEAEAGGTDLELKRAVGPTDEMRRQRCRDTVLRSSRTRTTT